MDSIEVLEQVANTGQAHLARRRKGSPSVQYDAKRYGQGQARGWFIVDIQSANAAMIVYRALKPENQRKARAVPLTKFVRLAWRHVT